MHISQWITLPTQLCLAVYSFYVNLLHSLIMWLMVSSLSQHYYYSFRVFNDEFSLKFESPQVSRTLLSILAVFNNAVFWMISTRLPSSMSSRPFNNPLVIVPKAPITNGIIITFMFHSFFNSLARSRYLSFFSHSFSFIQWWAGTTKLIILQIVFFFSLIIVMFYLLAEIRWFVCMSKSHRSLRVSFSRTGAGLCIYYLFVWSN